MVDRASKMKDFIQWVLFGFLLVLIFIFLLIKFKKTHSPRNKQTITQTLEPKTNETLHVISQVDPFSLTNQMGQLFTQTDVLGAPWLANIIFTRCPTVCPEITRTISNLIPEIDPNVNFISLTTDPEFDTPEALSSYIEANNAKAKNWHFLTGPKTVITKLAIENLKMISIPKDINNRDSPADLFIHSSLLVLVDSKGQVRGSFESDSNNLLEDIQSALANLEL